MSETGTDQLKRALESQHGGTAAHLQAMRVQKYFPGMTVSNGVVHVFELRDQASARRAYAWFGQDRNASQRIYTVLETGSVTGPADAVKAAIAAEQAVSNERYHRGVLFSITELAPNHWEWRILPPVLSVSGWRVRKGTLIGTRANAIKRAQRVIDAMARY